MDTAPFHPDEREAQRRAGVGDVAGAGIRAAMPDQHREFFARLPVLFAAAVEPGGWPLATLLTGPPGFVEAPDPVTLRIGALAAAGDPAAAALTPGAAIGLLGIDFATRRRNRANGAIAGRDAGGLTVAVTQSFGNCPKYIHARAVTVGPAAAGPVECLAGLDADARRWIAAADTVFVASRSREGVGSAGGADISHRGGRPGFVAVRGDTLTIPDFRGNRYFNTLGNLLGEPRAALLWLDFEHGDVLQLQGVTDIDWTRAATGLPGGAERAWRFHVTRAWRRRGAVPLRWSLIPIRHEIDSWRIGLAR
jgi:predicted pyridoxine 5'-phosphate oxidase superfamily flavin-nucleotide-binding protein